MAANDIGIMNKETAKREDLEFLYPLLSLPEDLSVINVVCPIEGMEKVTAFVQISNAV